MCTHDGSSCAIYPKHSIRCSGPSTIGVSLIRYQTSINPPCVDEKTHKPVDSLSLMHSISIPDVETGRCHLESPFQYRMYTSSPIDPRARLRCMYFSHLQKWISRGMFLRGISLTDQNSVSILCASTHMTDMQVERESSCNKYCRYFSISEVNH